MSTDIIIPSYGRANHIQGVRDDITAASPEDHAIIFSVETDDLETKSAVRALGDFWLVGNPTGPKNYANAINVAAKWGQAEFIFAGADDLHFHPGWLKAALKVMKDPAVMVVGTNDLLNPYVLAGKHATHYLIRRSYIDDVGGTWDKGPGIVLDDEFDHQYTDTAFIGVAKARGVFRPCLESVVEHMHFLAGKAPLDATYERAYRNENKDRETYLRKKAQWAHLLPNDDVL